MSFGEKIQKGINLNQKRQIAKLCHSPNSPEDSEDCGQSVVQVDFVRNQALESGSKVSQRCFFFLLDFYLRVGVDDQKSSFFFGGNSSSHGCPWQFLGEQEHENREAEQSASDQDPAHVPGPEPAGVLVGDDWRQLGGDVDVQTERRQCITGRRAQQSNKIRKTFRKKQF